MKSPSTTRQALKHKQRKMAKKTKAEAGIVKAKAADVAAAGEAKDTEQCTDRDCAFHGNLKSRGRVFKGKIVSKFPRRISIELERVVYIRKYERYLKSRTKIHARLPDCMRKSVNVGDFVSVQECRPLSKIIHFVVMKKIKSGEEK